MPKIIVTTRGGEQKVIDAAVGCSLMEAIRNSGIDEVAALCGGNCSCGTCHVHVDASRFHGLPSQMSDEEDALLDASAARRPNSRLACQIPVTDDLEGLCVTIAAGE